MIAKNTSLRHRLRRGKLQPPEGRPQRVGGDELKQSLERAGLSQHAFARKLGISQRMVSAIINSRARPSVKLSRRIRESLGLPEPSVIEPKQPDGTPADLWNYFHHVYKPHQLAGRNPVYVEHFTSAISCLYHVLGRDPLLNESITEAEIETMRQTLLDEEYTAYTATKYSSMLRAVLRHARGEEQFPNRSGRWRRDPGEYAPVDAPGTLWNFYLHRYVPTHMAGRSDGYPVQMEVGIRKLCAFCKNGAVGLNDLSDELLLEHVQHQLNQGLSIETARNGLLIVQRLWRYAEKKKLITTLPDSDLRLPRLRRQPQAWTMEQMGRLLRACQERSGYIAGIPAGPFWFAVIMLTYDTGLRLASVFAIKQHDLNRTSRWLSVPAENMKNRKEQRFILNADTIAAIEAIWEPQRALLFPWPHCRTYLQKTIKKILISAGLKFSRKDGMHKVRRTSATHLAAIVGIGEASRHLGHSDISTTMRYIDPTMMPVLRAGDILPRPVMPSGNGKGGAA